MGCGLPSVWHDTDVYIGTGLYWLASTYAVFTPIPCDLFKGLVSFQDSQQEVLCSREGLLIHSVLCLLAMPLGRHFLHISPVLGMLLGVRVQK